MLGVYVHIPEPPTKDLNPVPPRHITLFYFITGNPGLINYYTSFLGRLREVHGHDCSVAGASLGGFEAHSIPSPKDNHNNSDFCEDGFFYPPSFNRKPIYDLQDQISLSHIRLTYLVEHLCQRRKQHYPNHASPIVQVILSGHSVGAYIALEIIKRTHQAQQQLQPSSPPSYKIAATILLTPTIHDIALSPSGKLATPILSTLPFFPTLTQLGASALTRTLPTSWLNILVGKVTGMEHGSDALETTVGFLRSPRAVQQALEMARCEMIEIGEGKWEDEVWGAAVDRASTVNDKNPYRDEQDGGEEEAWTAPRHYFLFAKEDHWVADRTRDAIVQAVGGRAKIVVDEDGEMGLVHAWCLRQSETVAGIVGGWLDEILAGSGDDRD